VADTEDRLVELEREHADLQSRLPKHSVPMAMMLRLEDLEEEIARLRSESEPS
jgi:hypothetical protein